MSMLHPKNVNEKIPRKSMVNSQEFQFEAKMQVFAARFCGRCRFLSAFVDWCLLLSLFVDVCRIVSICECLKPGATEIEFWSPFLSICVGFCRFVSQFVELCRSVIAFHTKRIWRGCRERRKNCGERKSRSPRCGMPSACQRSIAAAPSTAPWTASFAPVKASTIIWKTLFCIIHAEMLSSDAIAASMSPS